MPRFSRISWNSRDDAEPPRIASRIEAAKRRSSPRGIPGALRHAWYCSVSLRRNCEAGRGHASQRLPHWQPHACGGAVPPLLEELDEALVLHVPRGREDDSLARVRAVVVRGERAPGHRRDDLGAADHGPPQRVRAEDRPRREVMDEVVRRVLDHRDLLEDDLPLGVHVLERRPVEHVRHDVERGLQAHVRDARVDDGRLARSGGVQLAAELVEELGDLLRRVPRRALEEQVLDEVGHARARVRLVPRARSHPEPERDRADARDALGDDSLAGRELGQLVLRHAQDRTRIRALTSMLTL